MARNSNTRRPRTESVDRAPLRANAASWRALANAAVASALVVALAISVLALLEAMFSTRAPELAQRSPALPATQRWRTGALEPVLYSPSCARFEPAWCDFD